jgi:hypothetical protein
MIQMAPSVIAPLSFGTWPAAGAVSAIRIQNHNAAELHVLVTATDTPPTLEDFNAGNLSPLTLANREAVAVNADTLGDCWPGKSLPLYFWGLGPVSIRVSIDHA